MTAGAVAVRERPIIMSAESVRAILAGRKTQTRRVLAFQPPADVGRVTVGDPAAEAYEELGLKHLLGDAGERYPWWATWRVLVNGEWVDRGVRCPFGAPGDRLWVRERHVYVADGFQLRAGVTYADDTTRWLDGEAPQLEGQTVYNGGRPEVWRWRSPIHMPRWASRITLEVTGVRAERLQEIGEADAAAEGFDPASLGHRGTLMGPTAVSLFAVAWNEINGKRHPWESNPWVWVVEFRQFAPRAGAGPGEG